MPSEHASKEDDFGSLPIETRYHLIAMENLALQAQNEKLTTALLAFVKHFCPLEDNAMLNRGARNCFKLAREAMGVAPEDQD